MSSSSRSHPGPFLGDPVLQLLVALEEVGADDLEPGIGEDLAFRAVSILIQRGVPDVVSQVSRGHPRRPGEIDGLVRIPEPLLAQPDLPPLAGHRVERPARDPREDQHDQGDRDEPGCHLESGCATLPDRGGPLAEVPGRHRPHDGRELVAVPRGLPAQGAEGHEEQQPERAESPGLLSPRSARRPRLLPGPGGPCRRRGLRLPPPALAGLAPSALSPLPGRGRGSEPDPDGPAERDQEAQRAQDHRRQLQLQREVSRSRTCWMKSGIGVNSPIDVEKIGLLIVRASSSG